MPPDPPAACHPPARRRQASVKPEIRQAHPHRNGAEHRQRNPLRIARPTQRRGIAPHRQAGQPHHRYGGPVRRLRAPPPVARKTPAREHQVKAEHRNQQQKYAPAQQGQRNGGNEHHRHPNGIGAPDADVPGGAFGREQRPRRRQQRYAAGGNVYVKQNGGNHITPLDHRRPAGRRPGRNRPKYGGGEGIRTPDPLLAKQVLSL